MNKELREQLAKPFDFEDVDYRVVSTTKDHKRGQVAFYIDARAVMDRLDEADVAWSTEYTMLDAKHVECRLTVEGVTRADCGVANDGGLADGLKGAYSDALKRAAVQFGIARYLHDQRRLWVDLDEWKEPKASEVQKIRAAYRNLVVRQPVMSDEELADTRGAATELRGGKMREGELPAPDPRPATRNDLSEFAASASSMGYTTAEVMQVAGVETFKGWTKGQLDDLQRKLREQKAAA